MGGGGAEYAVALKGYWWGAVVAVVTIDGVGTVDIGFLVKGNEGVVARWQEDELVVSGEQRSRREGRGCIEALVYV